MVAIDYENVNGKNSMESRAYEILCGISSLRKPVKNQGLSKMLSKIKGIQKSSTKTVAWQSSAGYATKTLRDTEAYDSLLREWFGILWDSLNAK